MEINENIRDFISSILAQKTAKDDNTQSNLNIDELSHYQSFLVDCINDCLANHLDMTSYLPNEGFSNLCKYESNAITCIFLLHSQIANINTKVSQLNLHDKDSFKKLYLRMHSTGDNWLFKNSLNYLDLSEQYLSSLHLDDVNFNNSNLSGTNLNTSYLSSTLFRESNLAHANIEYSIIELADFTASNLQNVEFAKSNLEFCNFDKAQLKNSSFICVVDEGDHEGLDTAHDLHLAHDIPEEWKQYIKDDVNDD